MSSPSALKMIAVWIKAASRNRGLLRCAVLSAMVVLPIGFFRVSAATFGSSFSLKDGTGKTISTQQFHGKFILVMFGYTHCPDFCPTELYTVVQALRQLGGEASVVQPLFITVDPARDSPAIVGRYVALFSSSIIGLSGSPDAIFRVEQAFHVYVGPTNTSTGAISHSSLLYVIGPDGQFLTAINGMMTASALGNKLRRILDANSSVQ
jgi:protein SCO1/2